MNYSMISTSALKELHASIQKCLDIDDSTPAGQIKIYGVREYSDWLIQLQKVEIELLTRKIEFSKIDLKPDEEIKPIPAEYELYTRIKECLLYEDQLPAGSEKPYGVRQYADWKRQAEAFEKVLDVSGHKYSKINW